ncbi:DUF4386 domain-containing protein [Nocardiopsis sp. RSe5-2]|uniref:DUF4386 domain-containing protein n=1 Tax=Nocardiopsis endophytica TaxID=3018445 RepID=A0ABT4UDK0_9ACTN|nr:DUF4386 domain-containing protein [Nocardiopsis endophytica]MDA2814995.1 DUF4386 domain-containing protein [Nocardiopsis endophytica]
MRPGPKGLARIAGALYLLVAVFTIFAGAVNAGVVEPGDAAATASGLRDSALLFRVGFVSELVGAVCFLATGLALYPLLRHAAPAAASAMVVVVAVSVAMQALNLVHQSAALTVATGQDHAGAFGPTGPNRLAALLTDMYQDGYLISQTFFGLWLLPLAYLVARSGYFPKAMGALLAVGAAGHLTDVFTRLLSPAAGAAVSPFAMAPAAVAEISFIVWLLVKAVRVPEPDTWAPEGQRSGPG